VLSRVSWAAVAALVFLILAFVSVALSEEGYAEVFALGAIAWAILSLKEQT